MKTIKLPYVSTSDLTNIIRQYSIIVRFSFNRFVEGKSEKDIRLLTKSLKNIDDLNSWLIQCGIKDAYALFQRAGDKKVIFGGSKNFLKRVKNQITSSDLIEKRLVPVNIQGEQLQKGNRMFKLDVIENNEIILKLNKKNHVVFKLPNLRNNLKRELFKLQMLNEVKSKERGYTYSVRFTKDHLYISFEEFKGDNKEDLNSHRYMGIDHNPENIGISILENENIIYTREFNLGPIFKKIVSEKLSSDHSKMKYYQNKLKHETFIISKIVSNLAKQYKCRSVYLEDLNFKSTKLSGSQKYNHTGNRKNKNL